MNLKFIFVGKTKDSWILEWEKKYLKYLKKYSKPKIEIIKEESKWEISKIKNVEWEKILEKIWDKDFVILLDVFWKNFSSEEFSEEFEKTFLLWKNIIFVISWAFWPNEKLKKRANFLLSFSKMTFTHQMIRPMLFEQIFRAFSIQKWTDYHK